MNSDKELNYADEVKLLLLFASSSWREVVQLRIRGLDTSH